MSKCTSIDSLVTPYVDGELSAAERTAVDDHLHRCPPCHARVVAEGAVRALVRAQKVRLTAECAPARLRAECGDLAAAGRASAITASASPAPPAFVPRATWRRIGVAQLALTVSFVLLVFGVFLYQATAHSSNVLAAELAADHVKCFTVDNLLGTRDAPQAVESSMLSGFGWHLRLPEQLTTIGLELVGARRCLYAEGKVAHLMFRDHGRPVSIFMLPKSARAEEFVEVLGHEAAIWSAGDRTFVLVTRGTRAEVQRMASFVKGALQ